LSNPVNRQKQINTQTDRQTDTGEVNVTKLTQSYQKKIEDFGVLCCVNYCIIIACKQNSLMQN